MGKKIDKIDLQRIEFNDLLFDCIVCLNSDLPSKNFFKKFENIRILAADGATIKLYKKGIFADFIIGDLDSFNRNKIREKFNSDKIFYDESQETNDFEKVLEFAIKRAYHNILVVGFHGGKLEHTLNNWSILLKYKNKLNLCVYEKIGMLFNGRNIELKCRKGRNFIINTTNRNNYYF